MALPPSDPAILVVSFDKYSDLWPLWLHYFSKHWPDCRYKVYLGSNAKTLENPRITPLMIGEDRDYSRNLLTMLDRVPEKWILLWLDDLLLTADVDDQHLARLIALAQNQGAAYMKPADIPPFAHGPADLGDLPPGIRYRLSLTIALWQKDVLRKIINPGENAWDLERIGSDRSAVFGEPFLSLTTKSRRRAPIRVVNAVIKGRWTRPAARILRKDGFGGVLRGRSLQPLRGHLYAMMFRARYAFLNRVMRRHWK